jgi:hypothetical protein
MIRLVALAVLVALAWVVPACAEAVDPEPFRPVEPPSNLPRA